MNCRPGKDKRGRVSSTDCLVRAYHFENFGESLHKPLVEASSEIDAEVTDSHGDEFNGSKKDRSVTRKPQLLLD